MWATCAGTDASAGPASAGCAVRGRDQRVDRERAERALIGEHDGQLAVRRVLDVEPHALVALGGRAGLAQQHLPAHAEVGDEGLVGRAVAGAAQRQPQELAAPRGAERSSRPVSARLEVRPVAGVPGQRALVEHRDAEHRGAADRGREAGADDLDLGEFRHAR